MIYQSTPDYYNEFISHANSHKYIDKYMGKNGKWVYVYNRKTPYERMNEGMENLRKGARRTATIAGIGALGLNSQFNSYMNKKAKKAAISAISKNQQFNKYMNAKASSAGKAVAGEASKRYKSAKNRATTEINKKTSAARKNASSMYNTAAGKAGKAYNSGVNTYNKAKSAYNTASGKAKSAYSSAKSKYNSAVDSANKLYKKQKMKAAGRKIIAKHQQARMVKDWVESDAAAYARAIKNTRKNLKRKKSR